MPLAGFENETVSAEVNQLLKAVVVRWLANPQGPAYQQTMDRVLELMAAHQAPKTLVLTEKLGMIGPDDQVWTQLNWMPRAIAAGYRASAVVVTEQAMTFLTLQNYADEVQHGPFRLKYFTAEADAKNWLLLV